ncbi:hypothetical protein B0H19DRAFT_1076312 [Mycena capillaripes]|nr:hypothetical protein B0H19DRAFT_1076312 [Mycena capillaripes]
MKATPAKRAQPATAYKKKKASPPVVKLPEGYAFIPPSVPLTYSATYHLNPAGPMNEASKHKRAVFRTLTNLTERVRLSKRKEPEVDLADESFCCRGGEMLLQVTIGMRSDVDTVAGFGFHFVGSLVGAFAFLLFPVWVDMTLLSITGLRLTFAIKCQCLFGVWGFISTFMRILGSGGLRCDGLKTRTQSFGLPGTIVSIFIRTFDLGSGG